MQVGEHPRLTGTVAAAGALAGLYYWRSSAQRAALERAAALQRNIRIVKQRPPALIAHLLGHLFSSHVRGNYTWLTTGDVPSRMSPEGGLLIRLQVFNRRPAFRWLPKADKL